MEEALRIAVAARVLFHNTRKSKSIIGGHYVENDLKLLSTTMFKPGYPASHSHFLGFIGLYPSIGSFKAMLDDTGRKENIGWQKWWAEEPIMAINQSQETITRQQLVLACANKDGGAHVDSVKPHEYERLENGLGFAVRVKFKGKANPEMIKLRYANLAALRQIGHEILSSKELTRLAVRA